VLSALEARGRRWMAPAAIVGALSLERDALRDVQRILRALEAEGRVDRVHGRVRARRRDGLIEGVLERDTTGLNVLADSGQRWRVASDAHARVGDRVLLQPNGERGATAGEILQVLAGARATWVGILQRRGRTALVTPYRDDGEWVVRVARSDTCDAHDGEVVVVAPTARRAGQRERRPARAAAGPALYVPPWGRVLDRLGRPGDPDADFAAVVWRRRLPVDFASDALAQAASISDALGADECARRVDLRDRGFVTIDPASARDHDDAVYVERRGAGSAQLWVAIADVSHYVPEDSPIDREALRRGNSVYFPDRAIPMLPERLSGDVCSLRPDVERAVLVVELTVDRHGRVTKRSAYPGLIRSRARLDYAQAARVMEGADPRHPQADSLCALAEVAARLGARRRAAGSIDFELPEARVVLDDQGRVTDVCRAERTQAHRAVEEAMLAANRAVAEWLVAAEIPAIHRAHDPPAAADAESLWELLGGFGLLEGAPGSEIHPRDIARALARVADHPARQFVHAAVLRCMRQARYTTESRGHFALAFDHYVHFTSPIRRYADLVTHRSFAALLASEKVALSRAAVQQIAGRVSYRERLAIDAEREMLDLKKCALLAAHVGELHEGSVTGVARHGLYVTLDSWFVEGLVHISKLPEYVNLDERGFALVGERSGRRYTLADRVRVRIANVDQVAARIDFDLV
jgi:ribonuclease R